MDLLFLTLLTLPLPVLVWALVVNQITYRQRGQMLDQCVPGDPDFSINMDRFSKASYEQHFWRVFTFRSGSKLYD